MVRASQRSNPSATSWRAKKGRSKQRNSVRSIHVVEHRGMRKCGADKQLHTHTRPEILGMRQKRELRWERQSQAVLSGGPQRGLGASSGRQREATASC